MLPGHQIKNTNESEHDKESGIPVFDWGVLCIFLIFAQVPFVKGFFFWGGGGLQQGGLALEQVVASKSSVISQPATTF